MTEWISVEDSPPEHSSDVWVWPGPLGRRYTRGHRYLRWMTGWLDGSGNWFNLDQSPMKTPTHYAEIDWPDPPKEPANA